MKSDLRQLVGDSLQAAGFEPVLVATAAEAHQPPGRRSPTTRWSWICACPDADGMDVLRAALDRYPAILGVVVTGFGGVEEAVTAIKHGAIDFLIKPFQLGAARARSAAGVRPAAAARGERRAARAAPGPLPLRQHHRPEQRDAAGVRDAGAGRADEQHGADLTARPAPARSSSRGPSITTARARSSGSSRSTPRRFPKALAEAELFGHTKGAFTGADRQPRRPLRAGPPRHAVHRRSGARCRCRCSRSCCATLQEREIERVGESRPIKFDARIIAASNTDLRKMVKEGTFREDLFYRLNVIPVTLPPLRERREDIPLLARHFVQKSCRSEQPASRRRCRRTRCGR